MLNIFTMNLIKKPLTALLIGLLFAVITLLYTLVRLLLSARALSDTTTAYLEQKMKDQSDA